MLFSVYPTDADGVREAVVAQAAATGDPVFTSLHLPEVSELRAFGEWLRGVHESQGLTFWADVSPHTLDALGTSIGELDLASWGVVGVRIDFGFGASEIGAFADAGLRIALNASTITAAELDTLAHLDPVGWHNFYPRPGTGLASDFFVAQSALFVERGLELFSFVPGESSWRAPLHLGLPTLEHQRHRNAYLNAVELVRLVPETHLVCAEGVLLPQHLAWISALEDGVITLPLVGLDPGASGLLDRPWTLRPEQSGLSQRLEGSRGTFAPQAVVNGPTRALGSVQVDLDAAGRYRGEVHVMASEQPLDAWQGRLADIAAPYAPVAGLLRGRDRVWFVGWDAARA